MGKMFRFFLAGATMAALILTGGCKQQPDDPPGDDDTGPSGPSIGPACDPDATSQLVSFVHVADLHANYTPAADGISPYSRIRAYASAAREQQAYTVFTNGGDDMEKGHVADALSSGRATSEITRAMQYDVRVVGNHDYAFSPESLLDYARDDHAVVLASNLSYTGDDPAGAGWVDYAEIQVGCVRVGFFGMVSKPWDEWPGQYEGDPFPAFPSRWDVNLVAQEVVDQHRGDVDLLVMVSHLGSIFDMPVLVAVDGIDVVLGGHTHDLSTEPLIQDDTVMIYAGAYAQELTHLTLQVELSSMEAAVASYEVVPLTAAAIPDHDAGVQATVEAALAADAPDAGSVMGYSSQDRSVSQIAEIEARAALEVLDVDAAIASPKIAAYDAQVWHTWGAGPLTQQDLFATALPELGPPGTSGWGTFLEIVVLTGEDLVTVRDGIGAIDGGWRFAGPETIEPTAEYTLALSKSISHFPDERLPAGVEILNATDGMEMWEVLVQYAEQRTAACLHIDADVPLEPCP